MIDRPEIGDQLVADWRTGGDRDAIAKRLFDAYYPATVNLFTRRGFSREESRDLAQDTFVQAFAALDRFRGECTFKTWLIRIAGNVLSNAIRHRKAAKRFAPELSIDELMEERIVTMAGPGSSLAEPASALDELLVAERSRLLYDAIGQLPPQMRRCLLLRLAHQLKYEEIATILGITTGAVKAHLFQARKKLKDALGYLDSALEEREDD